MSSTPNTHNLVIAAQSGDPVALARLLDHCQPDIRRYARLNCHLNHIDDAVQESLIAVTRRIHTLKAAAAFSGWLFTIIKRHCGRLFASLNRHESLADEHIEELLARKTNADLQLDLTAALESLPPHYLEIILLRDFEELSLAEISEHLGENIPAVKSRLHRARQLVREYLSAE